MGFVNAIFTSAFDNNLVFCQIIAMVTVLLVAKRPQDAPKFGLMLGCSVMLSGAFGSLLYAYVLVPWSLDYMAPLVYALIGAVVAFIVGTPTSGTKSADKSAGAHMGLPRAYAALAANAALMGACLSNGAVADVMSVTTDVLLGNAIGSGLGTFLAVVLFASVHQRIDETLVPHALRGLPISLVTASLMALSFSCVAGIADGLFV